MARPRTKPKSTGRRLERWMVGVVMGIVAFVLEKVVMRAVRKSGGGGRAVPEGTRVTSRGGDVDLPGSKG
jgi:hypothetical protein